MTYKADKIVISDLSAIYDKSRSFYGKAQVIHDYESGTIKLKSYNTIVCMIDNFNEFHKLWNGYSVTTMRHINEFIHQYGISGGGKKWWESLPTR